MRKYHIGLRKNKDQVVVEVRKDIDFLSCELWEYMGLRENTKSNLKENKVSLLSAINERFNTNFSKIKID